MANVSIIFNSKEFLLSCEDGQEDHLKELSEKLNERFNKLKLSLGNIGENKLLLITSIKMVATVLKFGMWLMDFSSVVRWNMPNGSKDYTGVGFQHV